MGVGCGAKTLKAVFFDRDGVLNAAIVRDGRPHPPGSLAQLVIDPAAPALLAALKAVGFKIFVVTNQPDVARGATTREAVEAINAHIFAALPIDAIFTCFHDTNDDCACRKPRPGMLQAAATDYGIDLTDSYLVGDRWSDIAAGRSVGTRTVFIDRNYAEPAAGSPDTCVQTLGAACDWIQTHSARLVCGANIENA